MRHPIELLVAYSWRGVFCWPFTWSNEFRNLCISLSLSLSLYAIFSLNAIAAMGFAAPLSVGWARSCFAVSKTASAALSGVASLGLGPADLWLAAG